MLAPLQLLERHGGPGASRTGPGFGWDLSMCPPVAVQPEAQGMAQQRIRADLPMQQPAFARLADLWHSTHQPQLGLWGKAGGEGNVWKEMEEDGEKGKEALVSVCTLCPCVQIHRAMNPAKTHNTQCIWINDVTSS